MDGTGNQNDGSDLRGTKRAAFLAGDDSSKSCPSSIGTPNDSEEDDQVQSNSNPRTGLDSMDSLQDSLPIKKGLSIHFDGKSKSFTDLSSANELKKQESPTNKRRRILTSSGWSRRAPLLYNCPDPNSMPLLPLPDEQDEDEVEEEKCREQLASPSSSSLPSSSTLTEGKKQEDDQQHDQEEEDA